MLKNLLFYSLIIAINSATFSFSINGLKEFFKSKGLVYNPYRVFGLPPWTSMKNIKKKYNELVRKYHPDKSHTDTRELFERLQKSYDVIKKTRKENEENEEEVSLSTVITGTIKSILNVELLFLGVYVIIYGIYKFEMLIAVPLFYLILSFTLIDNLIPHWFKKDIYEHITCLVVGFGLYMIHKKYIKDLWTKTVKSKTE